MIALAATIVRPPSLLPARNFLMSRIQLTFICGPDLSFAGGTKGPSGVEWGERFLFYKQAVLKLLRPYYTHILSWYDNQLFGNTVMATSASAHPPSQSRQGLNDIDDLIKRMTHADVTPIGSPSGYPAVTPHRWEVSSSSASSLRGAQDSNSAAGHIDPVQAIPVPEQEASADVAPMGKKAKGKRVNYAPTSTRKTRSGRA